MQIYSSTEYINNPTVGDLQLSVNSQWDFMARNVCFDTVNGLGNSKTVIGYDLRQCVEVKDSIVIGSKPPKPCKSMRWEQAEITQEIIAELSKKYTINKDYLVAP